MHASKKMGYQMKWVRKVGEISSLTFACFLVALLCFYTFASSGPFIAHSNTVGLNVQTFGVERDDQIISENIDKQSKNVKARGVLSCDLGNFRSAVCDIVSNVRIHGNSSSVFFTYGEKMHFEANKTWRIRPYTRKFDTHIMEGVREVTIRPIHAPTETPECNVYHNITAIVFAIGGYTGNFFHDFSDVLLPLFITSRQLEGEVQFLVANMHLWWIRKYKNVLDQLSNYEIIDFNQENKVHCYPRTIVGLYSHAELTMDPSRTPNNYSMVDFAKLMRSAYLLERDFPINLLAGSTKKPRLLILARNRTRRITNINEIVLLAEELGFEVTVNEASFHSRVGDFSRIVNSVDVMMGVHGAGLTHQVFLPKNAVLIQIVPFGNLERIAEQDFGEPARNMKLKYLQYSINEEESTLIDVYPRDHAVFRDPMSIHKQGWNAMGQIYLVQQSVKLNVTRFKPVLTRAFELLS